MGRGADGRAGAAAERGERVGRGARRAARAHRAPAHRGDPVDAHAPARGRAAAELGAATARVGRVRAERRHALGGRGVRGPAFRRPGRRSQHARRPARTCARARALRRPGARGGRGGRPGARRRGARFHRGRRSGRRARRARTGRAGLECASRRPTTGAARRGRGPDRGGTAQRGSAAAGDQCPAVPRRPRQPTPPAGARPNRGRRVGPRRHGAGARLERRGTRAAGVDRPVSREVERGPAVVSRRGAVRRRPARRRRPHDDGRLAAAGPGRLVPRARQRAVVARPGCLAPRRRGLAACGCPPGNGGKWGGGRGGAAGPPAPGRTRGGPARHPATGHRARAVRRSGQHWGAGRGRARCRARVGPAARTPGADRGGDPTSRAPDSHLSRERGGARGATRAGTGEGGDSAVMKRREFLTTLRRYVATTVSVPLISVVPSYRRTVVTSLLIPMDDAQGDHLKAYGVTYRVVQAGIKAEWLLNYRGGSFLLPDGPAIRRDAALAGVSVEPVEEAHVTAIRGEIEASNMDAVPLEKAPKVAVYVPPNAPPWDDAVTMALQYAGIQFDKVWDFEVIGGKLVGYDWLHLHHEDFTGQYSKFYLIYAGAPWLAEMVRFNTDAAKRLGFVTVPDLKKAVARKIRDYVTNGGFLFAMCTATETLDLALAAERVDIAAAFADGTPMDPQADAKLDWSKALAFTSAQVEPNPQIASFSDIDGHQVNAGPRRQPLGAFKLFNFSAKIDPVPTLLVQNHRQVIPDFYGLTTSFLRSRLKPSDVVLADEEGAPWVKYINGNHGKGTWTFFGGHDPEDQQHQIGDPPTDLSLHPHSPGYRLILNNVLFPAAKKRELKT